MTPEGKVKKRVKEILDSNKLQGTLYRVMPHGAGYGDSGVPDFLACYNGIFIGIECKAQGNKPTALQLYHLSQIRKAGGVSIIIDETNVDELPRILESIK
jgi:pantoate kinase